MYGKINQVGQLITNPNRITIGDRQIINPTEADLIAAGYKPVELTNTPDASEGSYLEEGWVERDGKIVQVWIINDNKN